MSVKLTQQYHCRGLSGIINNNAKSNLAASRTSLSLVLTVVNDTAPFYGEFSLSDSVVSTVNKTSKF